MATASGMYIGKLSQEDVLWLLRKGVYKVCHETGEVTGPKGSMVTPIWGGRQSTRGKRRDFGRPFVRLYYRNRRVVIAVPKLLWMSVTGQVVPPNFEIDHDDGDRRNNCWENLVCLHKLDHRKKRRVEQVDIPF